MSESYRVGNLENNPSNGKWEISVKTFFGHELKFIANADGSYSITTRGLKGLIDKILLSIFSKELDTRKAKIERSLENNNAPVFNEVNKSKNQFDDLVNREIEQAKNNFALSDKECNEIRERMSVFKGNKFTKDGIISVIQDTINQFVTEKYEKEDGNNNINNKLNINNHDKIDEDRVEIGKLV